MRARILLDVGLRRRSFELFAGLRNFPSRMRPHILASHLRCSLFVCAMPGGARVRCPSLQAGWNASIERGRAGGTGWAARLQEVACCSCFLRRALWILNRIAKILDTNKQIYGRKLRTESFRRNSPSPIQFVLIHSAFLLCFFRRFTR